MRLNNVKSILIFRALQIGDMLCTIPAIRAIRQAYPSATITLAGLPWTKMLQQRLPGYFNEVIPFPGYPGFPEQEYNVHALPPFIQQLQAQKFDLALQMHGSGVISNPLVALFNAKQTAGFFIPGNYCQNPGLFIEYPAKVHEVYRHLQLTESLGIATQGDHLEFPLLPKDYEDFEAAALPVKPKAYVVVHPGSRGLSRRWAPKNFAHLADICVEKGLQVVVTGTPDEADIVAELIAAMQHKAINASGKTSLGAVAVLIKNAALLLSNCTGVSHIASALQTKSLVFSLDGEAYRWQPLDTGLHTSIDCTANPTMPFIEEELRKLLLR